MKCRHTKRAVKALLCGERADIELMQEHFTQCARCREKYTPIMAIIRSAKGVAVPPVGTEAWRNFSAELKRRIRQEQPEPLGWWRSVLLWVGESKWFHLRKPLAMSAVILAIGVALSVLLPQFLSENGTPPRLVETHPAPTPISVPDLPPAMADVISIFGPDGFVTGVFSGYIQPGDFIAGYELGEDEIVEALDYLLS